MPILQLRIYKNPLFDQQEVIKLRPPNSQRLFFFTCFQLHLTLLRGVSGIGRYEHGGQKSNFVFANSS